MTNAINATLYEKLSFNLGRDIVPVASLIRAPSVLEGDRVMRRREFITLLGGAAAWPVPLHAQQSAVPVIGFLDAGYAVQRTAQVAAFSKGLAEGGFHGRAAFLIEARL
jgi:hypothetical protein